MDLYSTYPRPNQEKSSEVKVAKYSVKYMRQSKSVAVLWGVFTFCAAILNIVVFISEEWVGATEVSKSPGHFGLWKYCIFLSRSTVAGGDDGLFNEPDLRCMGSLWNFSSILSPAFRAATVFVGISVLLSILTIVSMLFFCIFKDQAVFELCSVAQALQAISMVVGILCFPAGWDNEDVRGICGKEAQDYGLGLCGIRWAFVMAFICVIDAFILSLLALVLSKRQIEPLPALNSSNNIYRGEVNGGFVSDSHSLNGSRKSLANMPSVMMVPHFQMPPNVAPPQPPPTPGGTLPPPEQYSDGQGVPPPYGSYPQPQMQNFQL
eukprot:06676.XXX_266151_268151_1 [CDS] Oithona nana genome sequencing.